MNIKLREKNDHKGMTLVEVVVSIAMLGLLAIAFLPMFSTGIKFIVNNGNQIKGMYANQNTIEQKIAQGTTSEAVTMTIVFPAKTIEIKGENASYGSLNLFITKK